MNTQVREEGFAPGAGAEIHLQAPERDHNGAGISLQSVERSTPEQIFFMKDGSLWIETMFE